MRKHPHGSAYASGPYSEPLANCRAPLPQPMSTIAATWSAPVLALLPVDGVTVLENAGFHNDGDLRGLLPAELVAVVPALSLSSATSVLHFSEVACA